MSSLPLFPVYVVDFIGAILMVVFSLIAFYYASRLTRLQPKSVLWTYMFWFSMALVALAVSRGIGHTVRFVLLYMGMSHLWKSIAPFSGALNTISFTSVAVLTFYYSNVRDVIERVRGDAEALYEANIRLQKAQDELRELNQNLERIVEERTQKLKQVMESLIQSEKMASVGQLAAGVAHEINTPLGIILGYAQLLKDDFKDDEDVRESCEIIEKQAKICKRIVADLLKFSRSGQDTGISEMSVNECIEEVLAVTEHSLNMDRIYVNKHLDPNLPNVLGNREKFRQVVINLLNNAHHAIESEGIVGIWTEYDSQKEEVRVIIGDTGVGIPPEIQHKIFDPFFTTKGVGKGTGLGLSVSFGIVKEYGGYIEAQSPPKEERFVKAGMETVMIIHLPVKRDEEYEKYSQT